MLCVLSQDFKCISFLSLGNSFQQFYFYITLFTAKKWEFCISQTTWIASRNILVFEDQLLRL